MNVCILISSCDKYKPIAEWTASRIRRLWAGHPPIYFSGLSHPSASYLVSKANPKDWMEITSDAISALREQGFTYVYLILDDLPPLYQCNDVFLNMLLPQTAQRLSATYIGLLGWGQHRPLHGKIMADNDHFLEQSSPDYRWKFSLHPGLWRLDRLYELLSIRMQQYGSGERTPWKFERHWDDSSGTVPGRYLESCYRVCGERYDCAPAQRRRATIQSLGLFLCDWLLFLRKLNGGMSGRKRLETRLLWPYCYYRGPYPLFWSGVMRHGKPSVEWETFLKWFNPGGIREEWVEVKKRLN